MQQHPNISDVLRLLEEAQRLVEDAAVKLSVVPGFADEWSGICNLYDQVKAQWHKVESRRSSHARNG